MKLTNNDILRIKQQDERFLIQLYNDAYPLLMSVAVRYKNNKEEQLTAVHNTFLKMLRSIDQFRLNSSFEAWLVRILRNELIDEFRRNHKQSAIQFSELNDRIAETAFDFTQLENTAPTQLLMLINELPAATKVVFNLYAIDEFTIKQISEALDISLETVKWHLKMARKTLRSRISTLKSNQNEIE